MTSRDDRGPARRGDGAVLVGTPGHLGQSALLAEAVGIEEGDAPPVDLDAERRHGAFILANRADRGGDRPVGWRPGACRVRDGGHCRHRRGAGSADLPSCSARIRRATCWPARRSDAEALVAAGVRGASRWQPWAASAATLVRLGMAEAPLPNWRRCGAARIRGSSTDRRSANLAAGRTRVLHFSGKTGVTRCRLRHRRSSGSCGRAFRRRITITDLAGDGNHYAAEVVDESFRGLNRVQQQRAVYAALKGQDGWQPR
jgi:hypothetical protein